MPLLSPFFRLGLYKAAPSEANFLKHLFVTYHPLPSPLPNYCPRIGLASTRDSLTSLHSLVTRLPPPTPSLYANVSHTVHSLVCRPLLDPLPSLRPVNYYVEGRKITLNWTRPHQTPFLPARTSVVYFVWMDGSRPL